MTPIRRVTRRRISGCIYLSEYWSGKGDTHRGPPLDKAFRHHLTGQRRGDGRTLSSLMINQREERQLTEDADAEQSKGKDDCRAIPDERLDQIVRSRQTRVRGLLPRCTEVESCSR
jgi:hypothetical protein